jgi:hypothetical protein
MSGEPDGRQGRIRNGQVSPLAASGRSHRNPASTGHRPLPRGQGRGCHANTRQDPSGLPGRTGRDRGEPHMLLNPGRCPRLGTSRRPRAAPRDTYWSPPLPRNSSRPTAWPWPARSGPRPGPYEPARPMGSHHRGRNGISRAQPERNLIHPTDLRRVRPAGGRLVYRRRPRREPDQRHLVDRGPPHTGGLEQWDGSPLGQRRHHQADRIRPHRDQDLLRASLLNEGRREIAIEDPDHHRPGQLRHGARHGGQARVLGSRREVPDAREPVQALPRGLASRARR